MPFVDSAGARIHWQAEGEGTPVLLIMGRLFSSAMWYPLLPALAAKHRAIRFDNRGTGDSDTTKDLTIAQFAADALAVLDSAGVERAHIYGVSLGGGIAAEFAMRYPERVASLVLGCTMMKTAPSPPAPWLLRLLFRLPQGLVRALLAGRTDRAAYGSAAPADAVERDVKAVAADRWTLAGVEAQGEAIGAYTTTREAVAAIRAPTLVLHGDEDRTIDVRFGRELADIIPGARLVVLAGAGHNYLVAANEASTAALLEFLAEVDGAPA